jgi:hypothetical protein
LGSPCSHSGLGDSDSGSGSIHESPPIRESLILDGHSIPINGGLIHERPIGEIERHFCESPGSGPSIFGTISVTGKGSIFGSIGPPTGTASIFEEFIFGDEDIKPDDDELVDDRPDDSNRHGCFSSARDFSRILLHRGSIPGSITSGSGVLGSTAACSTIFNDRP